VLIAARHFHHLYDGIALLHASSRPLHFLVTLDWVRGRSTRLIMEWATRAARWPALLRPEVFERYGSRNPTGYAFSAKEINRYRRQGLRQAIALLQEGSVLLIFPEGFPNVDPEFTPKSKPDEFLRFRSGLATILAAAERRCVMSIPVVPAGLAYRPGRRWTAHIRFGHPLFLRSFPTRRLLLNRLQQEVEALSHPPNG
jgi:putative membrane protein